MRYCSISRDQDALITCIPLATAMPIAIMAFVLTAYDCTRHLYEQRSRNKDQAAMWVTNGCTSMSKPITIKSTSMGVDNHGPKSDTFTEIIVLEFIEENYFSKPSFKTAVSILLT